MSKQKLNQSGIRNQEFGITDDSQIPDSTLNNSKITNSRLL
jgi:hypothetical protein